MRLRLLVFLVGAVVLASFLLASVALAIALHERDSRISDNTRMIAENARRQERNCLRIGAIVRLLDELTPSVSLTLELARIDAEYPDVPKCPSPR